MCRLPEPYELYYRYSDAQEREAEKFPKCYHCEEYIFDDYLFDIDDELYHEDCFCELYRKHTEYYTR